MRQYSFYHLKIALFFKNLCFQQPLRCYRNDLITSAVIVRIPFGPLQIVPWGVSHSIIREKRGQNLFFSGKFAFFFKNLCFQQPRRSWRFELVTCTVVARKPTIPCGPLYIVRWGLSYSIIRPKLGQNLFITERLPFFQKFMFCNLVKVTEMTL